jgi:hypothetical protein
MPNGIITLSGNGKLGELCTAGYNTDLLNCQHLMVQLQYESSRSIMSRETGANSRGCNGSASEQMYGKGCVLEPPIEPRDATEEEIETIPHVVDRVPWAA